MRLTAINFIVLGLAVGLLACQSPEQKAAQFNQLFNDAFALTQAEKHAESIPLYQKAIKTDKTEPRVADVYNNIGWAHTKLGNHQAAVAAYQEALKLKPDYQLARNNLLAAQAELAKGTPLTQPAAAPEASPGASPEAPIEAPPEAPAP